MNMHFKTSEITRILFIKRCALSCPVLFQYIFHNVCLILRVSDCLGLRNVGFGTQQELSSDHYYLIHTQQR